MSVGLRLLRRPASLGILIGSSLAGRQVLFNARTNPVIYCDGPSFPKQPLSDYEKSAKAPVTRDVKSSLQDNVALKVSFGLTFALAAFGSF